MLLSNIYCSITLSNYDAFKLKRFVSQFTRELCNCFLFYLYLIFHACVQIFDVMFLTKNSLNLNKIRIDIRLLTTHHNTCSN